MFCDVVEIEENYVNYIHKLVENGWNCTDLFLEERSQRFYKHEQCTFTYLSVEIGVIVCFIPIKE